MAIDIINLIINVAILTAGVIALFYVKRELKQNKGQAKSDASLDTIRRFWDLIGSTDVVILEAFSLLKIKRDPQHYGTICDWNKFCANLTVEKKTQYDRELFLICVFLDNLAIGIYQELYDRKIILNHFRAAVPYYFVYLQSYIEYQRTFTAGWCPKFEQFANELSGT